MSPLTRSAKYTRKFQGGRVEIDDLNEDTNEVINQIVNPNKKRARTFERLAKAGEYEQIRDIIHHMSPAWEIDPEQIDFDAVYAYLKD